LGGGNALGNVGKRRITAGGIFTQLAKKFSAGQK